MQPVIPVSILLSCVLSRPPPQWLAGLRGWAFRDDSLKEGKLSLDLEGERRPRLGVWWKAGSFQEDGSTCRDRGAGLCGSISGTASRFMEWLLEDEDKREPN